MSSALQEISILCRIRTQAECEAESKSAQRWQRGDKFEYLDRLSIDAGESRQLGRKTELDAQFPLVIVSQSADVDNVPTTCVILAALCVFAGDADLVTC